MKTNTGVVVVFKTKHELKCQFSAITEILWQSIFDIVNDSSYEYKFTRNPALRASQRARLVAIYIAVAIRLSSYVHRVTSEAVSFLPEVVAQI